MINIPLIQWKEMSMTQYNQWYSTDWDKCFLNDTIIDKKRYCQRPKPILGLNCGLGMGSCAMPIQTREYFFKYLVGFDSPLDSPLTRAIQKMLTRNQSMIFIGDSLMLQLFEALICQLHRENFVLHERSVDKKCHWIIEAQLSHNTPSLPIHFLRIGTLETINICPQNRHKSINGTGTWPYAHNIISNLSTIGEVFLIANIGVWYNNPELYLKDLTVFLHFLDSITRSKSQSNFLFLETFPSHWNTPSGYYPTRKNLPSMPRENLVLSGRCCYPIINSSLTLNWRNSILSEIVASNNLSSLSVLPTYEILFHHEHMHRCDIRIPPEKWDCTHYCYSPTLFQYIWSIIEVVATTCCRGRQCKISRDITYGDLVKKRSQN